jgi:hypothetical protein
MMAAMLDPKPYFRRSRGGHLVQFAFHHGRFVKTNGIRTQPAFSIVLRSRKM